MKKLISCDIDGILNDYPNCWLEYLALERGFFYPSIEEAKRKEPLYKVIKNKYRQSNFKENLQVNVVGVELLQKIKGNGYSIIIATSRPIEDPLYPQLKELTIKWLDKNNIPFDYLVFKNEYADFVEKFDKIDFHIEDDLKYAKAVSEKGILTFVYNQYIDHEIIDSEKVILVSSLLNILSYI